MCVIVVLSDKYLRSPNCMFELVEIAKHKDFYDRVFPIVLGDADIYNPVNRLKYIKYWEDKLSELDQAMKSVGSANLQGIREEIDSYDEIRDRISGLTSTLKDMNTLTPDMHRASDFNDMYTQIEKRLQASAAAALPAEAQEILDIKPFEPETVLIPKGPFMMGSGDETPQQVTLPSYRIGKHPITNEQYKVFLQQTGKLATPSMGWEGQRAAKGLENKPVSGVTWYEALSYCDWLKEKTGRAYSLPTEAEWEKACRSGKIDSAEFAAGIRQWTCTLWGEDPITPQPEFAYPGDDPQRNTLDAPQNVRRVVRGGTVSEVEKESACSARNSNAPDKAGPPANRIGFRVILKIQ
jgi:formylglycine-generating enzyme required for sulfatase activity